jgi:hypothetical protein
LRDGFPFSTARGSHFAGDAWYAEQSLPRMARLTLKNVRFDFPITADTTTLPRVLVRQCGVLLI